MGDLVEINGEDPREPVVELLTESIGAVAEDPSIKGAVVILIDSSGFVYPGYAGMLAADVVTACEIVKARNIASLEEYQSDYEEE